MGRSDWATSVAVESRYNAPRHRICPRDVTRCAMGEPPGTRERTVMTLRQMAHLFGRPLNTLQYWASRRGIKPLFRDNQGAFYPFEEFRLLHERRRKWRGKNP